MKFKYITLLTVSIMSLSLLSSCNHGDHKGNSLAKVNSTTITEKQIEERINRLPENVQQQFQSEEGKKIILEQVINEELLIQEAKKIGYEKNEIYINQLQEFNNQVKELKKQSLINLLLKDNVDNKITVTTDEIKNFYTENKSQFDKYEERKAQHILVKSKEKATELLNSIKTNKATFNSVAKEYSEDTTANQNGNLGWFKKGDLVEEFETVVFSLKKNEISKVVKTQFGYHIVKLNDTRIVPERKLEDVKEQIERVLYNQKRNLELGKYIESLKENNKVVELPKRSEADIKEDNKLNKTEAPKT